MRLKNCNSEEFINRLNEKKVICFGAGSTLIEADYEVLKIENLEDHIAFFVDNDSEKWGMKFEYRNQKYEIKSVEILKKINIEKYVLLITCAFYVEIYKQLKDVLEIKDLECYMYNAICSYPDLDVENFFTKEIEKYPFREWKTILKNLNLKDKHKGERCFIIGNGPSLRVEDLEKLKGEVTFAANRIFKIFEDTDWRPTYYICIDYLMYGLDHKEINGIDAKLRFVPIERTLAAGEVYNEITYYNRVVNCVNVESGKVVRGTQFDFSENIEDVVYGGQTVLYDALQIAVYMGFSEIYLLGVDFSYGLEVLEDGTVIKHDVVQDYFNEKYAEGLQNAVATVAPIYAATMAFEKGKEKCTKKGIKVRNVTRGGKLEVFERDSLENVLRH